MTKTTSIALGENLTEFIEAQVASGRYGSASEVVRDGVRRLQDYETKLCDLRVALQQGKDSGLATEFDVDAFIATRFQK